MIARIATVRVPPDRIDELVTRYREMVRPIHDGLAGLRDHFVLVERQNGHVTIVGLWDSREALEAAAPALEPARERLWRAFPETPTLEAYEVADELRNAVEDLRTDGLARPT
jgi:heme-degrading monooxygenase HmoA